MIFKKAEYDDIPSLINIRIAYLKDEHPDLSADTEKMIRNQLTRWFPAHLNQDFYAFVCLEESRMVASCFLCIYEKPANPSFPHGLTGTVMNVYTEKSYRGKGIATQLMHMLIQEAEKHGLDYIELKATSSGYPLYEKLGFDNIKCSYTDMRLACRSAEQ